MKPDPAAEYVAPGLPVRTFRKRPVEIQAVRFTGWDYGPEVAVWCGGSHHKEGEEWIEIPTLEGTMRADVGDWIIRGIKGEFYPCKPDIFEASYKELEDWERGDV